MEGRGRDTGLGEGPPPLPSVLGLWGELAIVGEDGDLPEPGLLQALVSPSVTLKKGSGSVPLSGGALCGVS